VAKAEYKKVHVIKLIQK